MSAAVADLKPETMPAEAVAIAPTEVSNSRAAERMEIDRAARGPVTFLFFTALLWLLVSTILNFVSGYKLQNPEFLSDYSFVTYGRVFPAYLASFKYGWCSLAGIGAALWVMSRLCRAPIRLGGAVVLGTLFWNLGVAVAVGMILYGRNTGLELMELPRPAVCLLFAGYIFVGVTGASMYRLRRNPSVFISVWYLLGAFFWFPWLFFSANLLTSQPGIHGVMQNVIAAWYAGGLQNYWFAAIGLGVAYYLIPKVVGQPIHSYNLAAIGFWSWAIFGGLTAMTRLSGGPVPAWLVSLSIASGIMLVIPVLTVGVNFIRTMDGNGQMVYHSPTVRFAYFGVIAFCIWAALTTVSSLRSVDSIVHFTLFQVGLQDVLLYSFLSMVLFGSIYYITPRLMGCEWLSSSLIKVHFLGAAYGGGLAIASLLLSGIASGTRALDPDAQFSQVIYNLSAYLPGRTMGLIVTTIGHTAFGLHFLLMLLRIGQPAGEPTLFSPIGEEEHH